MCPYGHTTTYWLYHFPAPTQPGINTPHNPSTDILHSPANDDGTDNEFRNVGNCNSDAGELPKKEQITVSNTISLSQFYMFRHYRVILRELVINTLQDTQVFQVQLLVIQFKIKMFHTGFMQVLIL